ncbi:hypothetical protein D3C81_1533660 [compost metagenome]
MLATGTFSGNRKASPDSCKRSAPIFTPPLKPPWACASSTWALARARLAAATRKSVLEARAWRTSSSRRGSWYKRHQSCGTGAETTLLFWLANAPCRSCRLSAASLGTS